MSDLSHLAPAAADMLQAVAETHLARAIEGVMAFERLKGRLKHIDLGRWTAGALGRLRYGGL